MAIPVIGGPRLPVSSTPGVNPNAFSSTSSNSSIDWGKIPGDVLKYFEDHWTDIAKALGGLASGYASFKAFAEGQKNSANSDALMHEGIDMAKQDYASRGQYRDAAQQHLLNPTRPDLSSMFADPGNPYKNKNRVPVVGGLPPAIPQGSQAPSPTSPPVFPGGPGPSGSRPISPITQPQYGSPKAQGTQADIANYRSLPPQVLGQDVPPDAAKRAYEEAQRIANSGTGGFHRVLNSVPAVGRM